MKLLKLIVRNIFRHKLRASLTILGVAVAVMAFGLLRTVVTTWQSGSSNSSPDRLIVRQAVSFIYSLPLADRDQIMHVPGVKEVTYLSWFGGVYIDSKHFFPRFAADAETLFDIYPEFVTPPDQIEAFKKERDACIIGRKLAAEYHLKVGDLIQLTGDIFPGQWQFVIRGIYTGKEPTTEETNMYFHWDYLNESLLKTSPNRANNVGWYVVKINNPSDVASISEAVDGLYANSDASTKTETEKAFQQGFVSMSSSIISALQIVSYVIIGIIFLVLANTMIMTARERIREYAVLKTLGFNAQHLMVIITGESLSIALIGGALGLLLTYPITAGFAAAFSNFFSNLAIQPSTIIIAASFAVGVGLLAAVFPAMRAMNTKIVDGLRQIG